MKKNILLYLCSLIATSAISGSTFYTGNELYGKGESSNQNDKTFALGYIAGVSDVLVGDDMLKTCVPENVTVGQMRDIVIKYLKDNPEKRHFTAHSNVGVALFKAFPCRK
jgi:hypothetical protein